MKMVLKKNKKKGLYALMAFLIILAAATQITVYAAMNNPLIITVTQVFYTSSPSVNNTFTYRLKPLESGNPMPVESPAKEYTFTITGNSDVQIAPIIYTQQGFYQYKLFQAFGADNKGYTYDKQTYTIEAHVDSELNAIIIVLNENGTKTDNITFYNNYYISPINPGKPALPEKPSGTTEAATEKPAAKFAEESTDELTEEYERTSGIAAEPTEPVTKPPYELDGIDLNSPPNPTASGHNEIPTAGGFFSNFRTSQNPKEPPMTGDASNISLFLIVSACVTAVCATVYLFAGGKRKRRIKK